MNKRGFYNYDFWLTTKFSEIVAKYFDINCIDIILDIGSRDLGQSLELASTYNKAKIYAIEAIPEMYDLCKTRNLEHNNKINIFNFAANSFDGLIDFYKIPENIGASSMFKLLKDIKVLPGESWSQEPVKVNSKRIDTFCKENNILAIDLIWMDVQGAELEVLAGVGAFLENVKAIHTEAAIKPYYEKHSMKNNIDSFLSKYGFEEVYFKQNHEFEGDVIYVNKKHSDFNTRAN